MLFNSLEFFRFLPVVLCAVWLAPRRLRNPILLAASYWFYGSWDLRFLLLLVASTVVDYTVARAMRGAPQRRRNALLFLSVGVGLTILGFFKYFGFFVDSMRTLLGALGLTALDSFSLHIVLPVGISFYTFQTMSYTIDVWRGDLEPCDDLVEFALYVAYFPQLVAGPIERATRLLPQIRAPRPVDTTMIRTGICLAVVGLFKKVVVSDAVASPYVDQAFVAPSEQHPAFLLLGLVLFSVQIYADFSGYSDVARGVSLFFGIELMSNFEQPYLSRSITEFWRRWHISLSTWLRDYLYIPLGGNRGGARAADRNLMVTMLLGGLWHGASWTFVIWGGLHGLYLIAHKVLLRRAAGAPPRHAGWVRSAACVAGTNLLVIVAWAFFRAPDLGTALAYLGRCLGIFASGGAFVLGLGVLAVYALLVLLVDAAPAYLKRHDVVEAFSPPWRVVGYALLVVALWISWPISYSPFIYFQF